MSRPRGARRLLLALFVVAIVPTVIFGLRSYHSLLLLRSAYAAGAPEVSSIRAWMSLRYLAETYRVPQSTLIARLGLPAETDPGASLKSLAEREKQSPFEYVQRVQRAVVEAAPSRYHLSAFLAFTVVGRMLWTSAYLGLGYAVGANLEAAASFLAIAYCQNYLHRHRRPRSARLPGVSHRWA